MPVAWPRSCEQRLIEGLHRARHGHRRRDADKERVRSQLVRSYQDTAFQEAAAAVAPHGMGLRRMLRAESRLPGMILADRGHRHSRFFPAARARYWILQQDIVDQETIMKALPAWLQATVEQTLQQYRRSETG